MLRFLVPLANHGRPRSPQTGATWRRRRALWFEPLEFRRLLATFVVDSVADTGDPMIDGVCGSPPSFPVRLPCTLRAALEEANALPDKDTISFAIVGPTTIATSGLQSLFPVEIDGTTQPGFAGQPIIELTAIGAANDGLHIKGDASLVKGLVINRFVLAGLLLEGDANQVVGNYIGTDAAGTAAAGNGTGIQVLGDHNVIGGPALADRNVISGNHLEPGALDARGDGIVVFGGDHNMIKGNFIGVNAAGDALGNDGHGILVDLGKSNQIGGQFRGIDDDDRNFIAANRGHGIFLRDSDANMVSGNSIGAFEKGNRGDGIFVLQGNGNTIGGSKDHTNTIIGNLNAGITLANSSDNRIQNNEIGIGLFEGVVPNDVGIQIGRPNANEVTTNNVVEDNVVSGNVKQGVRISGPGTTGNFLFGNRIGTDPDAKVAVANGADGVLIDASANKNQIGPVTRLPTAIGEGAGPQLPREGTRNVIAGNQGAGVRITDDSSRNRVRFNTIGADRFAQSAIPNQQGGVRIEDAPRNFVSVNIISGNSLDGVLITGQPAQRNVIEGNQIGTRGDGGPLGNAGSGIRFADQAAGNHVGPTSSGGVTDANPQGGRINVIAFNGDQGVVAEPEAGHRNHVLGPNSIHSNTGLGIDLAEDGVTPNDDQDADDGTNRLQNFPTLISYTQVGATNILSGTINATPFAQLAIDVYANRACDPSGFGEGETYLSSTTVTTDANGDASFTMPLNPPGFFSVLTATARSPLTPGNTSEFSRCLGFSPVTSAIQGRKFEDLDGDHEHDPAEPGRGGWTIELVDPGSGNVIDTTVTSGVEQICPPGPHFMATCPGGEDTFESVALVELDVDLDDQPDETFFLSGRTTILRGDAIDAIVGDPLLGDIGQQDLAFDVVSTELVDLALVGDGMSLTSGDGIADLANSASLHSPGAIIELPDDPGLATSRFEVFFEIETAAGTLHNIEPLPLSTIIDRIYPQGTRPLKFRDELAAPLSLFDENGVEQARLLNLIHTRNEPGLYAFAGLAAGTYLVREQPRPGWEQVFPTPPEYLVVLPPDSVVANRDFGNTPLPTADVVLSKSGEPKVTSLSDPATYEVAVTNLGPDDATNVVVTDLLPNAVNFQSVDTTHGICNHVDSVLTCTLGGLDAMESASISVVATTTSAGVTHNTASVVATEFDPHPANNHAATATLAADFLFSMPQGNGPDAIVLRRNGDSLEIADVNSGQVLASQLVTDTTTVAIIGADGEDDELVIDFSAGVISLEGGLHFFGGEAGDDSLALNGGSFDKVNHELNNAHDGTIELLNGQALAITYTGLEPIVDNLNAADRSFVFAGGTEDIAIIDIGDPDDGIMGIDSTASESIVFQVPSGSLVVEAGSGDDDIVLLSRDALLTARVTVHANTGSNFLDLTAATTDLTLISAGGFIDVLLAGSGDDQLVIDSQEFAHVNGGPGNDQLQLTGSGIHLDLPLLAGDLITGVEEIDLVGNGPNSVALNQDAVLSLSQETEMLLLRHDNDDVIAYGDGWLVDRPQFINDEYFHVLRHGSAEIHVANSRPWQNPFDRFDANRDGFIAPGDVLVTINTINRDGPRPLVFPTLPADVPPFYYDANGDQFVTPNDVLTFLNFINAQGNAPEGENSLTLIPVLSAPPDAIALGRSEDRWFPAPEHHPERPPREHARNAFFAQLASNRLRTFVTGASRPSELRHRGVSAGSTRSLDDIHASPVLCDAALWLDDLATLHPLPIDSSLPTRGN